MLRGFPLHAASAGGMALDAAARQRARASVLGALLADAATMPLHWICESYNQGLCSMPTTSEPTDTSLLWPSTVCASSTRNQRNLPCFGAPSMPASCLARQTATVRLLTRCMWSFPMVLPLPSPRALRASQTTRARCSRCWRARARWRSQSSSRSPPAPSTITPWAACLPTVRQGRALCKLTTFITTVPCLCPLLCRPQAAGGTQ